MNTALKLKIEQALDKVIDDTADEDLWEGYIHDTLVRQMTGAAEQVFDAAMEAQEYAKFKDAENA